MWDEPVNAPARASIIVGLLVVAVAIGVGLSTLVPTGADKPEQGARSLVGGPFELTAHTGQRMTDTDFRGRYMLIYFGFTYCPDVCPTELGKMGRALDLLAEQGVDTSPIQPLFITVDPERDTPEAMARYVDLFHPDMIGLTGTPEEIAGAARAYRVYYDRVVDDGSAVEYLMDHSSIIYLMDRDGLYLKHFTLTDTENSIAGALAPLLG